MATHSSILAWKIPEEPGGLQSVGLQRVRHNWACIHTFANIKGCKYRTKEKKVFTQKYQVSCPQVSSWFRSEWQVTSLGDRENHWSTCSVMPNLTTVVGYSHLGLFLWLTWFYLHIQYLRTINHRLLLCYKGFFTPISGLRNKQNIKHPLICLPREPSANIIHCNNIAWMVY